MLLKINYSSYLCRRKSWTFFNIVLSCFRLTPQQPTQPPSSNSLQAGAAAHCQLGGTSPLVMPVFPLRPAHTPHYSPYSPSRFHIDKRCQHRCSWKCLSIVLILLAVALTAMLAYFAGKVRFIITVIIIPEEHTSLIKRESI